MATRTDSPSRFTSGRGGAGNMSERRSSGSAADLVTPTIKSDTYTTGRGGSGNMTKLENIDNARKAQDVDGPTHRETEDAFHFGRGGAANFAKTSEKQPKPEIARQGSSNGGDKGLAEKIKEKIGLGNKQ